LRVSGETHVDLPRDRTFELFADLERSGEYSAPVIERRKLTDGPVGSGTRFYAQDQWPGRKVEFEVEITEFVPTEVISASWSEPMPGGWEARFGESDGGTSLVFAATMNPRGVMGLLAPLMSFWARRQTVRFLADFAAWAEKQGAGN
jgi:uncharacterized protein YndB with AHSA1/START domain